MAELILFIIILSVLILSHELGHFLSAKWTGMRVDEFGIGFPPKLFGFKYGETTYTINIIPFGGFVKIHGEEYGSEPGVDENRKFASKSKPAQALVIAAGVMFNFILAWILLTAGYMIGFPTPIEELGGGPVENQEVIITYVMKDTPAELAGIQPGDVIESVSYGTDVKEVLYAEDVINYVGEKEGKEIIFNYRRGKEEASVTIAPVSGLIENRLAVGINMETVAYKPLPPHEALYKAFKRTGVLMWATAKTLTVTIKDIFVGKEELAVISGPVGIYTFVGDVNQLGLIYILSFTAIISISLGIINLFPFPALDGGRLLFILIEAVKGSAINPKVATTLNYIGFALLIILMLIITYSDLMKVGILG